MAEEDRNGHKVSRPPVDPDGFRPPQAVGYVVNRRHADSRNPIFDLERFFEIAAKYSNVREDDDVLLMLEAIGFIMLVMKEIPDEIVGILKRAGSAGR